MMSYSDLILGSPKNMLISNNKHTLDGEREIDLGLHGSRGQPPMSTPRLKKNRWSNSPPNESCIVGREKAIQTAFWTNSVAVSFVPFTDGIWIESNRLRVDCFTEKQEICELSMKRKILRVLASPSIKQPLSTGNSRPLKPHCDDEEGIPAND